jgi:maltokinase
MLATDVIERHLAAELPSQRWFGASKVVGIELAREVDGKLVQVVARGDDGSRYHTILGVRDDGTIVDATTDHDLSLALFQQTMPGESVSKVRPLGAEQSNTSLVFDERLVLKLFRRLADGPNPDVEVTAALDAVGFEHVIAPLATWREGGDDYAVVNRLLASSSDGWHLAMTSLRDLYDRREPPDQAAGDFGFEAQRLGTVTAELHVAMRDAFDESPADVDGWVRDMEAQLARVDLPAVARDHIQQSYADLRGLDVGPAIRIHGDYHLAQTLRDDLGWFVLDFEGEPARPLEERRAPSSPLRDVAGMVRSLDYAAAVARREAGPAEDAELDELAASWRQHNTSRFLAGYFGHGDVDAVLPPLAARAAIQRAFELDKAVYEIAYEQGHRPDWVDIPLAAVHRLTEAPSVVNGKD